MAYTFLAAGGVSVGSTEIEEGSLERARAVLKAAQTNGTKIILPKDSLFVEEIGGKPQAYQVGHFPPSGFGVDIGPSTVTTFAQKIEKAGTVFLNGTMGIYKNADYAWGTKAIAQAIAKSHAYSVVGGGDAVASLYQFNLQSKCKFLSTGGGATLAFLTMEHIEDLPGIKALKQ